MYRASSTKYTGLQRKCPDSEDDVLQAFDEEVHIFMQALLSDYDRSGEGLHKDGSFSDMYGSPVHQGDSWKEGYHLIELEMFKHFHQRKHEDFDFPLIAGIAGGAYLYKTIGHCCEPWNWTGWVPRKKLWCTQNEFHLNRHFLHLRGNDIQNNLWDDHPHLGQTAQDDEDRDMDQPRDPLAKYLGGYWLKNNAWARYLHITCTKSHEKVLGICYRFNWITHPLEYRLLINKIPDYSLDGTQYSVLNVKYDGHFNDSTKWGNDVHGLEIFNDFTYFKSSHDEYNGQVIMQDTDSRKGYVYWSDTYPLEFGEFLLETSLERGVYFFAVAGNDVFKQGQKIKSNGFLYDDEETQIRKEAGLVRLEFEEFKSKQHLEGPYGDNTVFGHTTLMDTFQILKGIMGLDDPMANTLEAAEMSTHNWLLEGRYYSHTGVYDIFNYGKNEEEKREQSIPIIIENQRARNLPCYRMAKWLTKEKVEVSNELIFYFPKCKGHGKNDKVVWKYTLQHIKTKSEDGGRDQFETVHGYFRLNKDKPTRLNLKDSYRNENVKWILFSAINMDNPQRRAWFNPIKGQAFGDPKPNENTAVGRTQRVAILCKQEIDILEYGHPPKHYIEYREEFEEFNPYVCEPDDGTPTELKFFFKPCEKKEWADDMYVYNMQVCGYQLEDNEFTKNSKQGIDGTISLPPQVLQNITGYFKLDPIYPTRLNLSTQWDPSTVKDNEVFFYCIDKNTFQPKHIDHELKPIAEKGDI